MTDSLRASLVGVLLLGAGALVGCSPNGASKSAKYPVAEFKMISAGREEGDPNGGDAARVLLRWPEFTSTASAAAADSMATWIQVRVLAPTAEDQPPGDTTATIATFLEDHRAFKSENPAAKGGWYLERSVDVLSDTLGVVTLDMRENSFAGGAHPNTGRWLASFDPAGHQLSAADVLAEGKRESLDSIAEVYFRMARGLGPDDSLEEAGFQFPGAFRVNDNVGMTPAGLLFYFNDYEVGPHSLGPTEFVVPWAALKGLVRPDSPWAALAK